MFPVAAHRLPVNLRRLGKVALACSAVGLTLALSAGLTGCGGGSRSSYFTPDRIVSFGDENSAIGTFTSNDLLDSAGTAGATLKGLTYTVQPVSIGSTVVCTVQSPAAACTSASGTFGTLSSTSYYAFTSVTSTKVELDGAGLQRSTETAYNCGSPSIWVQYLAHDYGRGYNGQCALDAYSGAVSYAVYGAKSDDVVSQIAAHRGELNSKVLVTVMAGQHDILEQFDAVKAGTTSEAAAKSELQARADRMAATVKDIIGTGAKVVLALTPSLNDSPKGAALSTTDRELLARLVLDYNDRLYVRGLGDVSGRDMVGVNPDSYTNESSRSSSYVHSTALCDTSSLTKPDGNTTSGADADVQFCNTNTLVSDGDVSTYIWADNTHFARLAHNLVGSLAYSRARQQF